MNARYCRNCGFEIEYRDVRTGKEFLPPFWRKAWVHVRGADAGQQRCMWTAAPKRKGDRTLYQQIADARVRHPAEHDAALVAERDEAVATANIVIGKLAAAEAVIEKMREYIEPHKLDHFHPDGETCNGPTYRTREARDIDAILSGYPLSSAHTERDAEKWDEGWQQGFRDYQRAELDDGYLVITPTPCPYRVTPTEEPS